MGEHPEIPVGKGIDGIRAPPLPLNRLCGEDGRMGESSPGKLSRIREFG